jgi:hypothetical protein
MSVRARSICEPGARAGHSGAISGVVPVERVCSAPHSRSRTSGARGARPHQPTDPRADSLAGAHRRQEDEATMTEMCRYISGGRSFQRSSKRDFCRTKPSRECNVHVQRQRRADSALPSCLEPLQLVQRAQQAPLQRSFVGRKLLELVTVRKDVFASQRLDFRDEGLACLPRAGLRAWSPPQSPPPEARPDCMHRQWRRRARARRWPATRHSRERARPKARSQRLGGGP